MAATTKMQLSLLSRLYVTLCEKQAENSKLIELEAKFNTSHIGLKDFNRVAEKLLSLGFKYQTSVPIPSLKWSTALEGCRVELVGASSISEFSVTGVFPGSDKTICIVKSPFSTEDGRVVGVADYSQDYSFRIALSKEKAFEGTITESTDATLRYLHRSTLVHPDFPSVRVDMSTVRSDTELKPMSNLAQSAVWNKHTPTTYEIEIEAVWNEHLKSENFNSLAQEILQTCTFVLCGLQQTNSPRPYPVLAAVRESYRRLTGSYVFIGPSSVSLQLRHVATVREPNQYAVTDKADGERYLLMVNSTGEMFFINCTNQVIPTGHRTTLPHLQNSLIDGEMIRWNKENEFIHLFAAFDVYFLGEKDVRELPLVPNRLDLLQKTCNELKQSSNGFNIRSKTFRGFNQETMEKGITDTIYAMENELEYFTDGLIFTPTTLGVGRNKHQPNQFTRTWNESFKWKPPESMSIDFLVLEKEQEKEQEQPKRKRKGIPTVAATEEDGVEEEGGGEVILQVGESFSGLTPHDQMRFNVFEVDETPKKHYSTIPFQPDTLYGQTKVNTCYLPRIGGQLVAENGDVVQSGSIVECRYENNRWIPMRVRTDKLTPNHITTAFDNWLSIHEPVAVAHLDGTMEVPNLLDTNGFVYYNGNRGGGGGEGRDTNALRQFHNQFVKRTLIDFAVTHCNALPGQVCLLDLACGKGGDMNKWMSSNVSFVLGIDKIRDNIENPLDGACARYVHWKLSNPNATESTQIMYVEGDASKPIRQADSGSIPNQEDANAVVNLFKHILHPISKQYNQYPYTGRVGPTGFHVTSCQFAIHYMFRNEETLRGFLTNVSECTAVGGIFIATCFDGALVYSRLGGQSILFANSPKTGRRMWSISKKYSDDKPFLANKESLGFEITVYQESINQFISEYLVHPDYLTICMADIGFEPCGHEFDSSNNPGFEYLWNTATTATTTATTMSAEEKNISFLNRWFMFRKIR